MDNIQQSTPAHLLVTKETAPLINKPRRSGILLGFENSPFVFVLLLSLFQLRCFLACRCWRRWFAPRELKSRTVFIGSRYQTSEKQKNQVKNEIRNQVKFIPRWFRSMIHNIFDCAILEIQHHHFSAAGALRTVPILPQPLLSHHGAIAVHPRCQDRLPLHVLGTIGIRAASDDIQRGH